MFPAVIEWAFYDLTQVLYTYENGCRYGSTKYRTKCEQIALNLMLDLYQ